MGRVFVETHRNGQHGLKALPDPPHGKAYMVIPCEAGLVDKVSRLDAGGHWERELSEMLAREIERFFHQRPISIATPGPRVASGAGLSLYDPRDPQKQKIN
jgi:hypothetical protein